MQSRTMELSLEEIWLVNFHNFLHLMKTKTFLSVMISENNFLMNNNRIHLLCAFMIQLKFCEL